MLKTRPLLRSVFAAAALLGTLYSGAARAENASATAMVDRFSSGIIAILGDDNQASEPSRYRKLTDEVSRSFNLPYMMEAATGSRWRTASDGDRSKVVDAFLRMSIGTYLLRFDQYAGERFAMEREYPAIDGTTHVATRLVRPGRADLSVVYVTQKFGDSWRIVDLIFGGGISELAVRKSEFAGILSRDGLPGQIARLDQQADKIFAQVPANLRPLEAPKAVALEP